MKGRRLSVAAQLLTSSFLCAGWDTQEHILLLVLSCMSAVNRLVVDAYNANLADLAAHKDALEAAADALLEQEMLTGGSSWALLGPLVPVCLGQLPLLPAQAALAL